MTGKMVNYFNKGEKLVFEENNWAIVPLNEPGQGKQTAFFCASWRDIILSVVGTGTVSVFGSNQLNPPAFDEVSTIDNVWAPIVLADYSTANTYTNGTVTVSDATKIVELNTNLLTWIAIYRSDDTVDAKLTFTNAQ